jgi:stearoyl-CoA desaturase (delta-9 desaturase)
MHKEMAKIEKTVNLGAVILPFAATVVAAVLFWNRLVSPADLAIAAAMYLLTAAGVTVGFHRLLTHRSFQTAKPVEYLFAALGSMAVQGSVIAWVADHRKHHAHTDEDGDPHSPHVGHGDRLAALEPGTCGLEGLRPRPL